MFIYFLLRNIYKYTWINEELIILTIKFIRKRRKYIIKINKIKIKINKNNYIKKKIIKK